MVESDLVCLKINGYMYKVLIKRKEKKKRKDLALFNFGLDKLRATILIKSLLS